LPPVRASSSRAIAFNCASRAAVGLTCANRRGQGQRRTGGKRAFENIATFHLGHLNSLVLATS